MVIDCCGAPRPPPFTTSRPDRNTCPTSVGREDDMGLGIEEPKHDLGWPSFEATLSGHGASTGVINVSDQRYQNAVDGMENGMEDLEIRDGDLTAQIRIELVRIGPYKVK